MGPRAGLEAVAKRKIPAVTGNLNPFILCSAINDESEYMWQEAIMINSNPVIRWEGRSKNTKILK
jgi:hypothetical protein